MPRGNGTGPAGLGPITGRGAGFCAGYAAPGYANPLRGGGYGRGMGFFGFGRGRGGGRGWRNQYYATGLPYWARGRGPYPETYGYGFGYVAPEMTREAEVKFLKEQAEFIQKEMSAIQDRIRDLETLASDQKE
jgi:hypothetical protein